MAHERLLLGNGHSKRRTLYKNKKIKLNDIKDQVLYINEFYITDIKLEKISFKKKEVEDYVRDNNLLVAISNIKK